MRVQSCICGGLGLYQHLIIAFYLKLNYSIHIFVFPFPGNYWHLAHVKYLKTEISQIFSNTLCIYFQKLLF